MFDITNYSEHPTRRGYYVFRFYDQNRADYFKDLLINDSIWFESSVEEEAHKTTYLFGIKLNDYKKAIHTNYLVSAKYRKKTVSNRYARLFIYLFTLLIIIIAIYGALKSKS